MSRGLGDVYKRQTLTGAEAVLAGEGGSYCWEEIPPPALLAEPSRLPVLLPCPSGHIGSFPVLATSLPKWMIEMVKRGAG